MEEKAINKQQVLKRTLEEAQESTSPQRESDLCVICLESISERATASPCKHESFDFLCLLSWLRERSSCPLCKSIVRSVQYRSHLSEDLKVYKVPNVKTVSNTSLSAQAVTRGRPQHASWRSPSPPRPPTSHNSALIQRKDVYRHNLYSSHVGSNRISKYKDLTPQIIARDEALLSRARKWIRRELKVFEFLNADRAQEASVTKRANNAEFLTEYIVAILKTVDIKGAGGQAEDILEEFLGRDNTRLFLHELRSWLRSPYDSLEDWDRHVQYNGDINAHSESAEGREDHKEYDEPPRMPRTGAHYNRMHRRPIGDRYSPYHDHRPRYRNPRFRG